MEKRHADLIKAYHALKQKETMFNSIIRSNTPISGMEDAEGLAAFLKNMQLKNQMSISEIESLTRRNQELEIQLKNSKNELSRSFEELSIVRRSSNQDPQFLQAQVLELEKINQKMLSEMHVTLEKTLSMENLPEKVLPDIQELKAKISDLESEKSKLLQHDESISKINEFLTDRVTELEAQVTKQLSEIGRLESLFNRKESEMKTLQETVDDHKIQLKKSLEWEERFKELEFLRTSLANQLAEEQEKTKMYKDQMAALSEAIDVKERDLSLSMESKERSWKLREEELVQKITDLETKQSDSEGTNVPKVEKLIDIDEFESCTDVNAKDLRPSDSMTPTPNLLQMDLLEEKLVAKSEKDDRLSETEDKKIAELQNSVQNVMDEERKRFEGIIAEQQKIIVDLEAKLRVLETDLGQAVAESINLKDKLDYSIQQISQLKNALETVNLEKDGVMKSWESERSTLNQKLEEAQRLNESLISSNEKSLGDRTHSYEKLKEQSDMNVKDFGEKISKLAIKIEDMSVTISDLEKEKSGLLEQLSLKRGEVASLEHSMELCMKQSQVAIEESTRHQNENERLEMELRTLKSSESEWKNKHFQLANEIAMLRDSVQQEKEVQLREQDALLLELEGLKQESSNITPQLEAMRENLRIIQIQHAQEKSDWERREKELVSRGAEKLSEHTKMIESLREKISDVEKAKSKQVENERETGKLRENLAKCEAEKQELKTSLNRLTQDYLTKEEQLKVLNRTLQDEVRKLERRIDRNSRESLVQEETTINLEYLKHIVIKFVRHENQRPHLLPVLSVLLNVPTDQLIMSSSANSPKP